MEPEYREEFIAVGGEQCRLLVYRMTKTTWRACGDFMKRSLEGDGATAHAAIKAWESKATGLIVN
jgi:hypothetical protein